VLHRAPCFRAQALDSEAQQAAVVAPARTPSVWAASASLVIQAPGQSGVPRAQRTAAELGIALVCPDTSPRGLDVPGEADSWDFGVGAGFYLNATQERWRAWRMYAYVTEELPAALQGLPALDVRTVRSPAARALAPDAGASRCGARPAAAHPRCRPMFGLSAVGWHSQRGAARRGALPATVKKWAHCDLAAGHCL